MSFDYGSLGHDPARSEGFNAGMRAERASGARVQKLRRLIDEADRAARFLADLPDETARYRARELRSEIAAARMD